MLLVGLGSAGADSIPGPPSAPGSPRPSGWPARHARASRSSLPPSEDPAAVASAMVEGALVGTRSSGLRKTEPNRHPFAALSLVVPPRPGRRRRSRSRPACGAGEIVGQAVNLARDLANTPPAEKSPAKLAERIRIVAEHAGLAVDIWDAVAHRAGAIRGHDGCRRGLGGAATLRRAPAPQGRRFADAGPRRQGRDLRLGRAQHQAERARWKT